MKNVSVDNPDSTRPPQWVGKQDWVEWGLNHQREMEGSTPLLEEDLAAIWDAGFRAGWQKGMSDSGTED